MRPASSALTGFPLRCHAVVVAVAFADVRLLLQAASFIISKDALGMCAG